MNDGKNDENEKIVTEMFNIDESPSPNPSHRVNDSTRIPSLISSPSKIDIS